MPTTANNLHKLASLIREGSAITQQARSQLVFHGPDNQFYACAFGAALIASGRDINALCHVDHDSAEWPIVRSFLQALDLEEVIVPALDDIDSYGSVAHLVFHNNWTSSREEIADHIDSVASELELFPELEAEWKAAFNERREMRS